MRLMLKQELQQERKAHLLRGFVEQFQNFVYFLTIKHHSFKPTFIEALTFLEEFRNQLTLRNLETQARFVNLNSIFLKKLLEYYCRVFEKQPEPKTYSSKAKTNQSKINSTDTPPVHFLGGILSQKMFVSLSKQFQKVSVGTSTYDIKAMGVISLNSLKEDSNVQNQILGALNTIANKLHCIHPSDVLSCLSKIQTEMQINNKKLRRLLLSDNLASKLTPLNLDKDNPLVDVQKLIKSYQSQQRESSNKLSSLFSQLLSHSEEVDELKQKIIQLKKNHKHKQVKKEKEKDREKLNQQTAAKREIQQMSKKSQTDLSHALIFKMEDNLQRNSKDINRLRDQIKDYIKNLREEYAKYSELEFTCSDVYLELVEIIKQTQIKTPIKLSLINSVHALFVSQGFRVIEPDVAQLDVNKDQLEKDTLFDYVQTKENTPRFKLNQKQQTVVIDRKHIHSKRLKNCFEVDVQVLPSKKITNLVEAWNVSDFQIQLFTPKAMYESKRNLQPFQMKTESDKFIYTHKEQQVYSPVVTKATQRSKNLRVFLTKKERSKLISNQLQAKQSKTIGIDQLLEQNSKQKFFQIFNDVAAVRDSLLNIQENLVPIELRGVKNLKNLQKQVKRLIELHLDCDVPCVHLQAFVRRLKASQKRRMTKR